MSHYEEHLERDLQEIRDRVAEVGEQVLEGQRRAVQALLTADRALAAEVVLGDLPINRAVRSIDHLCHVFVARHLPSAGHLRTVSSVLRLDIELERIGDYAASIAREAVQLGASPPEALASGIALMAEQSHAVLEQALRAWNEGNPELARGTLKMAGQAAAVLDKVYHDLEKEGESRDYTVSDVLSLLAVLTRLGRVADQSKNLCEETLFATLGETKEPKTYRVHFVDAGGDGFTQLALAYARKAYGDSCEFTSAGWQPREEIEPRCRLFMERRGLASEGLEPVPLVATREALARYHVVVSFGGDLRPHVERLPFQTVFLEWDLGPTVEGFDQERALARCGEAFDDLKGRLRQLVTTLRGPEAI